MLPIAAESLADDGVVRFLETLTYDNNQNLNRKFRYKRTSPSQIRHNLISILVKSCSARGCSDLLPKELRNKTIKTNK